MKLSSKSPVLHFSQCALPYLWSIFGFYQRTDLVSNLMPLIFLVQVHCNMHAFCNHVSLNNIFLFPKIEYEKKNILILYKVLMEKKYMPEGYRNFQSMYIKKYIYAMTKLFFIIACK